MSYCLNPDCQKPQNSRGSELCRNCGATLRLKERYRPVKLIGQGGFGRTFLAIDEDKPSQPRCVIKQFLPAAQDPRHLKKAADLFDQEAIRLEELGSHPQIPTLLAYFNQGQRQYLVQEFVAGKNLAELLQQSAFTEAQVWDVLISLLPVLEFIHAHRVIHRDIKPSNIIHTSRPVSQTPIHLPLGSNSLDWEELQQALAMEVAQSFRDVMVGSHSFSELLSLRLAQPRQDWSIADYSRWQQAASSFAQYSSLSRSQRQYLVADASRLVYEMRRRYEPTGGVEITGHLVLVDFGAAKSAKGSALMRTGTTIGSPEYLAPEQARGKAVFSSDLYSLGVTCAHLLTNTSPFDLFDTHENAWVWRRYLANPVSDRLGQILDKLLESGVNRRYRSASEVINDLVIQPSLSNPQANPHGSSSQSFSHPSLLLPSEALFKTEPTAAPIPQVAAISHPAIEQSVAAPKRRAKEAVVRAQWQCVHQLTSSGKVFAIALSPIEPILVSSSGTNIRLWDVQTGQPIRNLTGHVDIIHSLVISPDGKLLISGGADKSIKLWNLQTGQRLGSLDLHTDTVLSLALSSDGRILASGSLHDPIRLWDRLRNQECGNLAQSGRVDALAFSPDNMLASSGADATIALWTVGADSSAQIKGHAQQVVSLAFSPDGKTLVSGSWDGSVKLWSTSTRREKRSLQLESGRVNAVAFSSSGKVLITGSDTLMLWNPRTGKALDTLDGHSSVISAIAVGSDDRTFASSSWDGTIRIWRLEK